MLDYGIFYEFIPTDDSGKMQFNVIPLAEVNTNTVYAMVITTTAGLWRYQLGDTIRFTSIQPYRFIITGRTKHHINVFGEELMIHNAEMALKKACEKTHAMIIDYTVAPQFMTKASGTHEWLIEFEKQPENKEFFMDILDKELKLLNSDYEAKRFNDYVIGFPLLTIAPGGTFLKWLHHKNKLGGQHKVPRLFNERTYIDEIKTFLD